MSAIAIIGMACRYPEARSPRQLWENVLAQRRSFRRIPALRLRTEDYASDPQAEDRISVRMAAVLEDYEFDRVRFQVSRETFLSTDMVHWLALDVASQALGDARLLDAGAEQRERIGVYVGNSLTGEFSRANLLRLRWPYVRRVLAAALHKRNGASSEEIEKLLEEIETQYKAPFPPTTEESLAGGLSNTIAGRICNYFDLKGGGYTVDGACASSLLAVTTACSALEAGDVDVAIAGGVDLSLDPFELAGFSKLGALAGEKMRVFDAQSAGFWPGEGCGMVVLMRHEEALAQHHSPYAVIRGWGISSDGSGGITRPEMTGQLLAIRRAYQRAQYGIDSVTYFEGHGTGTSVGDATELQALSLARREARPDAAPAALGSIKANIGHTKAAAGVAGLIKAAMATQARILPPTTGCDTPHRELTGEQPMLRILKRGEMWPDDAPLRSAVSAMGFGGINTHVTLAAADTLRRSGFTAVERRQLSSAQDCELFLFSAADSPALAKQLQAILPLAAEISYGELTDLAAHLAKQASHDKRSVRAACVAATPEELEKNLGRIREWCLAGAEEQLDMAHGAFLSTRSTAPRIAFLFPGQGSPVYIEGGMWSRRFACVRELYQSAHLPETPSIATETAQPCVVAASLAGLRMMKRCGMEASLALGHSLGELTALGWAGACDEQELLGIAFQRGRIMAAAATASGSMASIRAGADEVKRRLNGDGLVIAAYNSPNQTVVSGDASSVRHFTARLNSAGVPAQMLPVSHAFHSPLVENVATAFCEYLSDKTLSTLQRSVVSTVTGSFLPQETDLRELLTRQVVMPVRFAEAATAAAEQADLLIEVGPGSILSGLAAECIDRPAIALNAGGESLRGLLLACGAAFAMGAPVRTSGLFEERLVRDFDPDKRHAFLENPCEKAADFLPSKPARPRTAGAPKLSAAIGETPVEVLRNLVARRTELPVEAIRPDSRFLDDLHLNSITISHLILEAAAQLGLPTPVAPAEYTNASIREAATALKGLQNTAPKVTIEKYPAGIEPWIRPMAIELVEHPLRQAKARTAAGSWQVLAMNGFSAQAQLEEKLRAVSGKGVVCCVPPEKSDEAALFLLESVQSALQQKAGHVIFLQRGGGAAALARSLSLEHPQIKVTIVDAPLEASNLAEWVAQEAAATSGFTEAHYDDAGIRREPRLKLLWPQTDSEDIGLGADDLLLVTGGGKGIASECALQLARDTGCRLALVGRSDPANDPELKENLQRFSGCGIRFGYFSADIAEESAARQAIERIQSSLGTITAVLHGAGVNVPRRLEQLTALELQETIAPKLRGLENVLRGTDAGKLRLLLTFGSIIARTGLHGEAHYGLANEWMSHAVEKWQTENPHCRCLNLEWSVWAGIGMGQKLGVLDSLVRQGITPLPLEEAIRSLRTMLAWKQAPKVAIVSSRFGNLPTIQFSKSELPLLRFLEKIEVHYPGIELVTEAEMSAETDPYVSEHKFQGERLFPAVSGIEAMAQVAMALEESGELPEFRNVRFDHPIVVPERGKIKIRIAALRRKPGTISVAVRCSNTSFHVDHFKAECVFGSSNEKGSPPPETNEPHHVPLDPTRQLYGGILFHHGRFCRVEEYQLLRADRSIAQLAPPAEVSWYARHLPPEFVAGDAASRDAAIHSIQACIPHRTVLPVSIDRIIPSAVWTSGRSVIDAIERKRDGDNFTYDLFIQDSQGKISERWEGLCLHAVTANQQPAVWPAPLLGPYLERRLGELLPATRIAVGISNDKAAELIRQMLGPDAELCHRADGKPEVSGPRHSPTQISISHCGCLTLIVSSAVPAGCDLQEIIHQEPSGWEQMLGKDGLALAELIAKKTAEPLDIAATKVWTLKESLRKAHGGLSLPLRLESSTPDHWIVLSGAGFTAAATHLSIETTEKTFAIGFVTGRLQ